MRRVYEVNLILLFFCLIGCAREKENDNKLRPNTKSSSVNDSVILKKRAKDHFNKYISRKASGGREINDYYGDSGLIIRSGDINGDNLNDVIIEYSFEPTKEETGGGGNINIEIKGLVVYLNHRGKLVYKGIYPDYPLSIFKRIKNNKIYILQLSYADTDAYCCPSIHKIVQLKYNGRRLVKIQ